MPSRRNGVPMSDDRLRALAREEAFNKHAHFCLMKDQQGHVQGMNDLQWGFSACPHPDCVLVRTPAAEPPTLDKLREMTVPSVDAMMTLLRNGGVCEVHDGYYRRQMTDMLASYGEMLFKHYPAAASPALAAPPQELDLREGFMEILGIWRHEMETYDWLFRQLSTLFAAAPAEAGNPPPLPCPKGMCLLAEGFEAGNPPQEWQRLADAARHLMEQVEQTSNPFGWFEPMAKLKDALNALPSPPAASK